MPHGAYRVFLGGQAVSLFGDGLALLAVPLLVLRLTDSPLLAGLASAVRAVGYVLVGVPAGPLVDRLDARSVLIWADAIRAVLFAALGVLAWTGGGPVAAVLAIAFAAACASVFFDAALAVTVQDLFPGPRLLPANATLETASQLSRVLGPAAAGVLVAWAGAHVTLLINAATFVVALLTVLGVRGQVIGRVRTAGGVLRGIGTDYAAGLRYLWRHHPVIDLTVLITAVNLCLAVDTLIIFFAQVGLGLGPVPVSAVLAAGGAGGVVGAIAAPRLDRRFPRLPLIVVAVLVAGVAVAAMTVAHTWWALAAANAVMIFGTALGGLLNRSLRQELVAREMLGRVTVAARTLGLAATPAGALIAGSITAAVGNDPRPVFLGAGVLLVAVTFAAWCVSLRGHARARRAG